MENNGTVERIVGALSGLAIFFVFTAYVFLNAQLQDKYGDLVFLVLLFLALPRLGMVRLPGYRPALIALFWSYLALTLASVLFPSSAHANVSWLVAAQYRIIFSALIVLSLLNLSEIDRVVLRWGTAALCLLLSTLYILQHNGFAVQESLAFLSPLKTDLSDWHDKNFAIWQLLLMWGKHRLSLGPGPCGQDSNRAGGRIFPGSDFSEFVRVEPACGGHQHCRFCRRALHLAAAAVSAVLYSGVEHGLDPGALAVPYPGQTARRAVPSQDSCRNHPPGAV
jgi:hypothetical protein